MELDGKAALVTGGTSGIGLAIADAFRGEGARVVVTGRDARLGDQAQASLGPAARFLRSDAADPEQVERSVEEAVEILGGLDVLVNNAGIGVAAGVLETPDGDYDRVMAVNVRGPFLYAKAAFPYLEERGGSMIHITSDAGVLGQAEVGVYSVSKAALGMLSAMLAIEGGPRGVRSNAIAPGDIEPGMRHFGVPGDPGGSEDDPAGWDLPPLGRIGRADDVAGAAVFLASDRASFVNGATLLVDGGMRAGFGTPRRP